MIPQATGVPKPEFGLAGELNKFKPRSGSWPTFVEKMVGVGAKGVCAHRRWDRRCREQEVSTTRCSNESVGCCFTAGWVDNPSKTEAPNSMELRVFQDQTAKLPHAADSPKKPNMDSRKTD